jgi:hypothetical protein
VAPSLRAAIGLALRAAFREPWLIAVAFLVSLMRRAAVWPAWAVATFILGRAVVMAVGRNPVDPFSAFEGVRAVLSSPRFLALVAGLWLAGILLGGLLRVAYLAGALPTLGASMAGAPGGRFATGIAFGFPRVLAAAALALALDLAGALYGATLVGAALRITVSVAGSGASPLLAAAVALALTLALLVPIALSTAGDVVVARAAVLSEGPGEALAAGAGRFLARPGTFVLAALAFAAAGLIIPGAIAGAGSVAMGFATLANPLVQLGPRLMVAVAVAVTAAAVDLVWLGTVAALACADAPPPREVSAVRRG